MSNRPFAMVVLVALLAAAPGAQTPAKGPLVERVGDTGFIQLQARSFAQLDDKQKQLAYWLTQASIAIDPIIYDQLSRFGLRQKRLLEGVMAHHAGVPPATFAQDPRVRAALLGQSRQSQRDDGAEVRARRSPSRSWQDAALKAQAAGAFASASGDLPPLATADAVKKELADLQARRSSIRRSSR